MSGSLSERVDALAGEFAGLEPRERLELLLEFAEKLAPLPARYQAERDAGAGRVHECQTPVFLWVEIEDGKVHVFADVAPEAPTVKGFVSLLSDLFADSEATKCCNSSQIWCSVSAWPRPWAWCACAACRPSRSAFASRLPRPPRLRILREKMHATLLASRE